MTIRQRFVVLICWLSLLDSSAAISQESHQFSTEAGKANRIKSILAKYPLKFQPDNSRESAAFCDAFYFSMKKANKAISYIEPVIKTDDINHPGLARYRSCPNYPGPGENVYPGDLHVIGDRAFRLYRLDAASKFKNGLEEIIYGEQEFLRYPESPLLVSKRGSMAMFTGYQQVDFSDCSLHQTLGVRPSTGFSHSLKETFNAIVRHKQRYYVLATNIYTDQTGEAAQIDIYSYQPSNDGVAFFPLACDWKYLSKNSSGDKE